MGLFANRAATRQGARQQYRTMARMQRRRSYFQSGTGMHQDFQPRDDEQDMQQDDMQQTQQTQSAEPDYTTELKELAQLKNQGLLTEDEFTAKKKQLLGI